MRIEVGYGLEGALTDALSKVIIATAIAPQFQKGDFAGGIDAGVDAILSILTGDAEEWQRRAEVREDDSAAIDPFLALHHPRSILVRADRALDAGPGGPRRRPPDAAAAAGSSPAPSGGGWGGGWSGGGGGGGRRVLGRRRLLGRRRRFGELVDAERRRRADALDAAIRDAEANTAGEIVLVVARPGERLPLGAAALWALLGGARRALAADLAHGSSARRDLFGPARRGARA